MTDRSFLSQAPALSRRGFLRRVSFGVSAITLAGPTALARPIATGVANRSLGVVVVGLGRYAGDELAPALQQTRHCHLAGIVTGTPAKAEVWSRKYNLPNSNIYNYKTFDQIANNPNVDVVYVVLPNAMHAEYTIRAARAGKHVICEKPMAVTVKECEAMIEACRTAGRSLSIGYRLHFEPYNREMMRLGQQQVYGKVKLIESSDGFRLRDPNEWRLHKELAGGGALMDIGIYAIQGARFELLVILPGRQQKGLEPVFQLVVAANCQIGLARTQAGKRDAQLVTEVAQQVQQLALARSSGGQQILQLVQHQHAAAHLAEQTQRHALPGRRSAVHRPGYADPDQDGGVEPIDCRRGRHLHQQHRDDLTLAVIGGVLPMRPDEMLRDGGLAVVSRPDHEQIARSNAAGLAREQPLQQSDRLVRPGIADPAVGRQAGQTLRPGQGREFVDLCAEVRQIHGCLPLLDVVEGRRRLIRRADRIRGDDCRCRIGQRPARAGQYAGVRGRVAPNGSGAWPRARPPAFPLRPRTAPPRPPSRGAGRADAAAPAGAPTAKSPAATGRASALPGSCRPAGRARTPG